MAICVSHLKSFLYGKGGFDHLIIFWVTFRWQLVVSAVRTESQEFCDVFVCSYPVLLFFQKGGTHCTDLPIR